MLYTCMFGTWVLYVTVPEPLVSSYKEGNACMFGNIGVTCHGAGACSPTKKAMHINIYYVNPYRVTLYIVLSVKCLKRIFESTNRML